MAKRKIVQYGDDTLRRACRPVERITPNILTLLDDMAETMSAADGVGLAAPQVGVLRRAVIVLETNVDIEAGEAPHIIELINPEIVETSGEQEGPEGCLSVPGKWGYVKRPLWAKVRAQDRNGEWFEVEGTEVVARCFCHELGHLDGQLYVELVDKLYTNDDLDAMYDEQEDDE